MIAVVETPDLISLSDEEVLSAATEQGRCMVTANVRDFVTLSGRWARTGRVHAGIVYVVTAAFPQHRSYVGGLVRSLDAAISSGQIPSGGQEFFLRRTNRS